MRQYALYISIGFSSFDSSWSLDLRIKARGRSERPGLAVSVMASPPQKIGDFISFSWPFDIYNFHEFHKFQRISMTSDEREENIGLTSHSWSFILDSNLSYPFTAGSGSKHLPCIPAWSLLAHPYSLRQLHQTSLNEATQPPTLEIQLSSDHTPSKGPVQGGHILSIAPRKTRHSHAPLSALALNPQM